MYVCRCRKCNQWNHWEQVCRNKQAHDRKAKPSLWKQTGGWIPQAKTSQNKVHTVEQANSNSDELFFETIQIDSSHVTPVKDEAFAKLQVKLHNINRPNPVLKVKVNTGTQGNILPLWIYRKHVSTPCGWKWPSHRDCTKSDQTDCIQWNPNTPA